MELLSSLGSGMLSGGADHELLENVAKLDLKFLMEGAGMIRDMRLDSGIVTFSPKAFVPLTRVCRDSCGYCTFARGPKPGKSVYMSLDEVMQVADAANNLGCTEVLFTTGDKPELLYSQAREELSTLGHATTVSYIAEAAGMVLEKTGLLPHINAGVLSRDDIATLRRVSASQGLMLETTSMELLKPGGPHHGCPDKIPSSRLETIAAAGELKVPFTSGLLVGIGETRTDRLRSLLALRELHERYGHIQELIIQNFRAKKGTDMANAPEPLFEELLWTVAMARIAFGPSMSIQAPPNLTSNNNQQWELLIKAGINDWGGISPLTRDWVNPELPWPHIKSLASATMECGKVLLPRLPVYPQFANESWLDTDVLKRARANSNSLGYARAETWSPGSSVPFDCKEPKNGAPTPISVGLSGCISSSSRITTSAGKPVQEIIDKAIAGEDLEKEEIERLFHCLGSEFEHLCEAADKLRESVNGKTVTYVVNRNINYTNVCEYKCQFCAFSKGKLSENLRGKPYRLSLEDIAQRTVEAWERGATEVCMQGGIHPEYTGETYLEILRTVKAAVPEIHVHAFSPLEVSQGAATIGLSVEEFLKELKAAGLGSLPGTAAEVLDDNVRSILCPDKIKTREWLEVMELAHHVGLPSTSTIMFGHIDKPSDWATHLLRIRELQKRTGGFTEFVPLPFVHMQAPIYLKGKARRGPTKREAIAMHAVARLALHPFLTNIQASWVKMGPGGAQFLLTAGCNDMGGSLMNESISRAAGASHGEELQPDSMKELILSVGRQPCQRSTLYKRII